jgi:hypothetical protein
MRESRTTTRTRTRRITKADPEVGQEARFTLADPAADIKNRLSRSFALPYFYREPGRIKIKIRSRSRSRSSSVQKLKAKSKKRKAENSEQADPARPPSFFKLGRGKMA